jgi:hypothetical protein
MVKLICNICGYEFLVHSGHYWRYPSRVNKCPQENCSGRGQPDETGREQMKSRNEEVNQMRYERERKSQLEKI